jgi:hypothetical protein
MLNANDLLSDPLYYCRRDGISDGPSSTTVQPGGNPISASHSVHVKFLATENWSVRMTALMASSLGTYRGAKALSFGIPEASATLNHKRRVSINEFSNIGSNCLPPLFSRLKIPVQFAAVSKEAIGTFGSITCDKENSVAVVGQARIESIARNPSPQIPIRFEGVDNCFKRGSFLRREEARHIFQDKPPRVNFSNKLHKVMEESATATREPLSIFDVRIAEILAGPSCTPEFSGRDSCAFEGGNV